MTKQLQGLLTAALLGGMMSVANAASVSLMPASVDAVEGGSIAIDVVIDFSDDPTLGGGIDINWDSAVLAFDSWSYDSSTVGDDVGFRNDGVPGDGSYIGQAVGNFNGLTTGTIGTITLVAVAAGDTMVSVGDTTNAAVGPWVSAVTFGVQNPEYSGANVTVNAAIPLPAAAWLMFGGLGALLGFRRKA